MEDITKHEREEAEISIFGFTISEFLENRKKITAICF